MLIFISYKKTISLLSIALLLTTGAYLSCKIFVNSNRVIYVNDVQHDMLSTEIREIFKIRNNSILEENSERIKQLYNNDIRNGRWACEHALKKMRYLHSWSGKQGVKFISIDASIKVRYIKEKGDGFTLNLMVSTAYTYAYEDSPGVTESFKIGTYHSLDLMPDSNFDERPLSVDSPAGGNKLLITREWYTDPFADSLNNTDEVKNKEIKEYILSSRESDLSQIKQRRKKASAYAEKYCGAANFPEDNYQYNPDYKNYNNLGGDCANFASQILFEGGGFRKNPTWNYYRGAGSRAWINASAFNNYMLNSGRATQIARGSYEKVYKQSYKLLPGDYIAYEKKGKVVHISVVSGCDSKGYSLVISHNTDRYQVPWDLGWSNRGILFRLVRVHY